MSHIVGQNNTKANTDNMGKLFPAFFRKKRDRSSHFLLSCLPAGRCSCTQDKFVMVVAPGYTHLHAIKIIHLDKFLAPRQFVPHDVRSAQSGPTARHCTSTRLQICNRGYPDSYRDRGSDQTCTPAFDLQKRGRRDTRNAQ